MNVGTIPAAPSPASSLLAGRKTLRRLMLPGWSGGPVVVAGVTTCLGGRESRPQGEGVPRVRSRLLSEESAGEHRCAVAKPHRGERPGARHADQAAPLGDLGKLVYDPAFLVVAWHRVRANTGARTAGVDGLAPRDLAPKVVESLQGLRAELKARRFIPEQVRQKVIPKSRGNLRRLGIPSAADRVVRAALKLVLEPICEADFKPCSYGFRPRRRTQDAIAEIHFLPKPPPNYEWVFRTSRRASTRSTTPP